MSRVCYQCQKRYPACGDTCKDPEYLKDREKLKKKHEVEARNREINDAVQQAVIRMQKRRRKINIRTERK